MAHKVKIEKNIAMPGPLHDYAANRPDLIVQKLARNVRMVEEYTQEGKSSVDLAAKYNISRERVCQILRPHGVIADKRAESIALQLQRYDERQQRKQERKNKTALAMELVRQQGISYREAAIRVGLTQAQFDNDRAVQGLRHLGLNKHGRWGREREWAERKRIIRKMRGEGASWDQICAVLGVTSVYAWCKEHMPEVINVTGPRSRRR